MRLNLLVGVLLLYCSVGSAANNCTSYEDCINHKADWSWEQSNAYAARAIAFKLDEIEKIMREKKNATQM